MAASSFSGGKGTPLLDACADAVASRRSSRRVSTEPGKLPRRTLRAVSRQRDPRARPPRGGGLQSPPGRSVLPTRRVQRDHGDDVVSGMAVGASARVASAGLGYQRTRTASRSVVTTTAPRRGRDPMRIDKQQVLRLPGAAVSRTSRSGPGRRLPDHLGQRPARRPAPLAWASTRGTSWGTLTPPDHAARELDDVGMTWCLFVPLPACADMPRPSGRGMASTPGGPVRAGSLDGDHTHSSSPATNLQPSPTNGDGRQYRSALPQRRCGSARFGC